MVEDELLHDVNPELLKSSGNRTNVLLPDNSYMAGVLEYLCEIAGQSNRQLVIYLSFTAQSIDLSDVLRHGIKQLHIICTFKARPGLIVASNPISNPFLTHLSIIGHPRPIHSVMSLISKAIREGELPCLRSLSFPGTNIKDQLKKSI